MSGSKYCGLNIGWNYPKTTLASPCPNTSAKPWNASNAPPPNAPNILPTNGSHLRMVPNFNTLPTLQPHQNLNNTASHACKAFPAPSSAYQAPSIPPFFSRINKIGSEKASLTTDNIKKTKMLMYYAATQPDTIILFHASDMCLHIDSDAAYLVQPKSRSCAAGHYYLS